MTVRNETGSTALAFQFDWNEAEHVRMLRAADRHRPVSRLRRAVLVACYLGLVALVGTSGIPIPVLMAVAPWCALLAALFFALRRAEPYVRARARRLVDRGVRHPLKRIISAQGLGTERTKNREFPWKEIRAVVETPEFFLFYLNRRDSAFLDRPYPAIQLPRRAILTPEDLERLRGLLREQLPTRAQLLGPS